MTPFADDATQPCLPRSYLRPCLLLLLAEGGSHGYEMLDEVHALGLSGADTGGLYRTLRGMERDGFVRSWWEPSQSGPARRTYELTEVGAAELGLTMAAMASTHRLLGDVLQRHDAARHERQVP